VTTAANATGLDIDKLVKAVMVGESGGRQYDKYGRVLTSKKGALGKMQLEPGTARDMGVDPNDPAQNVLGGARYLEWLFGRYGNLHDALAAYNWGPRRVDEALRKHHAFPAEVERYAAGGMQRYSALGGDSSITIGQIVVTQPNASAEHIANTVAERLRKEQNASMAMQLAQLRGY
jgi:hypothetical protein